MKRSILIITLLALGTLVAWAEPPDDPQPARDTKDFQRCSHGRGRGHRPGPGIQRNLSDEQREKMQALRREFRPKFREAMQSHDQENVKAVHEEFMNKAGTFLDDEQIAKLRERHEKIAQRMKRRRAQMGPKLDLNDEQKAKLKELREKHQAERKALREKHQGEMKKVLTPEQQEKWEAWRKEKEQRWKNRGHDPRGRRGGRHRGPDRRGDGPPPPPEDGE